MKFKIAPTPATIPSIIKLINHAEVFNASSLPLSHSPNCPILASTKSTVKLPTTPTDSIYIIAIITAKIGIANHLFKKILSSLSVVDFFTAFVTSTFSFKSSM